MSDWLNQNLNDKEIELAQVQIQEMHPLQNVPFITLFESLQFLTPIIAQWQAKKIKD